MALNVPNVAEDVLLNAWLGKAAQTESMNLRLWVNASFTPSDTDTTATYTEAAGGGYAAITLAPAAWTVSGGTASAAQQVFTFTGALTSTPATIEGYYFTRVTTNDLMWSEKTTSFTPANNGDQYKITPTITAN